MGKAIRDKSGKFLPGNTLALGNKNEYQPRTTSITFINLAKQLLDHFPIADVAERMSKIDDAVQFMVIYNKFLEESNKADQAEFKRQLDLLKHERESNPIDSSNDTIEINFIDLTQNLDTDEDSESDS